MLLLSLVSFVAGTAEWLVPVVLGAGWEPVVPLIRVMCVAGVFHAIANIIYWVMLAQGKTGLLFGSELGVRLVMIALITAAVAKGPLWVALASAVGQGLLLVSFVLIALPRTAVPPGTVLLPALRPLVLFTFAAGAAFGAGHLAGSLPHVVVLLIATTAFAGTCAVVLALPGYRRDVGVLWDLVRSVRGGRRIAGR